MSNPPFGIPLYSEEDDFNFPIQSSPNDPINFPPLNEDQNPNLPSTSSSQPMSEFQDLSMFLGDDYELDYTLIEQLHETIINWPINPIEQVGLHQGSVAEGSSLGHHEMLYNFPTAAPTMAVDAPSGGGGGGSGGGGGGEESSGKKLDHNAREKVRRMKLNEAYLTLRSLLPDSKRAKKKWSAPYIIDRVLDYIPQLQDEIEKLTLEKTNMVSVLGNNNKHFYQPDIVKSVTVSMNEVKEGEVIIQICDQNNKGSLLLHLIEKLEEEKIHVLGASSQCVCEDRSCFHLHLQMGETPVEADYVAVLHKKIISWLS